MSYELNSRTLVYKTKPELIAQLKEEIEQYEIAEENYGEGEGDNHIGNIEQITYVLRHCEYEGREQ